MHRARECECGARAGRGVGRWVVGADVQALNKGDHQDEFNATFRGAKERTACEQSAAP